VDLFDDEAEQGLFLVEVEGVDHGEDPGREVADAAAQLVVAGERVALRGQGIASFGEVTETVLDVGGAAARVARCTACRRRCLDCTRCMAPTGLQ
jgi:hypothetical protein